MGHYFKIFLGVFFFLLILGGKSFGGNIHIYYPGSFDLFHLGHSQEVKETLRLYPNAKLSILPIQTKMNRPGFPFMFDLFPRIEIIRDLYQDDDRVEIDLQLWNMQGNIFEALSSLFSHKNPEEVFILIGVDVLEKWSQLKSFDIFLKKARLLVSFDPNTPRLNAELSEKFRFEQRIEFHSFLSKGVRSKDITLKLVNNDFYLEDLLHPKTFHFLYHHRDNLEKWIISYIEKVRSYLLTSVSEQLFISFKKAGVPDEVITFIQGNRSLLEPLAFLDMREVSLLGKFVHHLAIQLPLDLRKRMGLRLGSLFYRVFQHSEVTSFYHRNSFFREVIAVSSVREEKIFSKESIFSKANGAFFLFYKNKMAWFFQYLRKYFLYFNMEDSPTIKADKNISHDENKITVYRGISNREGLNDLLKIWLQEGFLSKAALKRRLRGASFEESIQASERVLQQDIQKNILEHIFGAWKSYSPFIATTLDKEMAETYAGPGGFVFKIEVSSSRGYFLNDFLYWEGTPWEQTGNPAGEQQEFVVRSFIRPEEIVSYEKVLSVPRPVLGFRLGWLGHHVKALVFSVENRMRILMHPCQIYLKKFTDRSASL